MLGGIYTHQKCPLCAQNFQDNGHDGLICPSHLDQKATRFRVFFRGVSQRFDNYERAWKFLSGLRLKVDEGIFDPRDYRKDNPLGFATLAERWLELKQASVKRKSYGNLKNYIGRAVDHWGQTNIKSIGYGEIEDFLLAQKLVGLDKPVSAKTKANMRSCLHDFWQWLRKRRVLHVHQVPEFPEAIFELGFRKTIDKRTQEAILEEIHRLTYHINPKIWLGVKWLATYISIRPKELTGIKEEHIDLERGFVVVPHPKEKRPKLVPLLREDVEIIKSLPRGLPHLYFFRHMPGRKGCKAGQPFGEKYFYKWWIKACASLGIDGVDLYAGTRHSSAMALREFRTPEEIKRATMHSTNKAFERYFQIEGDALREIYSQTQPARAGKEMVKKSYRPQNGKVLKLDK